MWFMIKEVRRRYGVGGLSKIEPVKEIGSDMKQC